MMLDYVASKTLNDILIEAILNDFHTSVLDNSTNLLNDVSLWTQWNQSVSLKSQCWLNHGTFLWNQIFDC